MAELHLDDAAIQRVVGGYARDAVERAGQQARRRAAANAPIDTGRLASTLQVDAPYQVGDLSFIVEIFSPEDYAIFQERGTRGSVGNPFLVFRPKGSGTLVFARRTGPVPATRFMERAINSIGPGDFY